MDIINLQKRAVYLYICGSPTQNIISWCMQCLEMNCFSTQINNNKWTTSISPHLLAQIRPCQMIIQSVLPYCLQPCAILSASLLVSSRLWRKFTWHENQHNFVSTQHRYTKRQKHTSPPATKTCCNSAIIVTEKSSINHHTYSLGNTSYYPQFS